ncbi:hypothetical protein MD484_g8198, partial [Candolleomyces efflorescens]
MADNIPFSVPGKTICIFLAAFASQMYAIDAAFTLSELIQLLYFPRLVDSTEVEYGRLGSPLITNFGSLSSLLLRWPSSNSESMYIHGASSAACDILITISLVVILRSTGSNNIRRTQSLLQKLVTYAINRGILTSVCALLSIFLYDFASGTYY